MTPLSFLSLFRNSCKRKPIILQYLHHLLSRPACLPGNFAKYLPSISHRFIAFVVLVPSGLVLGRARSETRSKVAPEREDHRGVHQEKTSFTNLGVIWSWILDLGKVGKF
jgi:hypothetical protein